MKPVPCTGFKTPTPVCRDDWCEDARSRSPWWWLLGVWEVGQMRRFTVPFLVVAVALIGSLAVGAGPGAGAQDAATPTTLAGHPLVGSWLISAGDPSRPETLNTFWADGNALFTLFDGTTFQCTWVATGPRTAALTMFAIARPPDEDPIGLVRISSSFNEVSEA